MSFTIVSVCNKHLKQTIESCGLQQHIDQETHYLRHTLDILITRDTSNTVAACEVRDVGLCDNVDVTDSIKFL